VPHVGGEDRAEAAHPGLAREVEDTVRVAEVELVLGEVETGHVQPGRVPLLPRRVVVVGEGVDAGHFVAG
jgi:hypothetical protein